MIKITEDDEILLIRLEMLNGNRFNVIHKIRKLSNDARFRLANQLNEDELSFYMNYCC